jgi:hypothetical protein
LCEKYYEEEEKGYENNFNRDYCSTFITAYHIHQSPNSFKAGILILYLRIQEQHLPE